MTRRHCIASALLLACAGVSAAPSGGSDAPAILVVGDSLSAEYGLRRGSGWVSLLQQRLSARSPAPRVFNASISGDTTAGGRARLPALLKAQRPQIVILELGSNDALRGLPLASTRTNLAAMVDACQAAGARVLLLGSQVPPNYGRSYTEQFSALFQDIAREKKTALVPFFLKGVADVPDAGKYFQADRMHPNESAHPIILGNVWPALQKMLG